MKNLIKASPDLIYNYSALIEMPKKQLLLRKVWQIEVGTKIKALRQKDNQTLSKFISILEALEQEIKPIPTDAQWHQNLLYSIYKNLRCVLMHHNKVKTT